MKIANGGFGADAAAAGARARLAPCHSGQLLARLVPVVLGLEGARARQVQVVGLGGAERRQLDAELVEVERGDLLVEVLGQHVDLVLVFAVVGKELDLRQYLVGERGTNRKSVV